MKPTNVTVTTPEGLKRKRERLITKLLQERNPFLYDALMAEVELLIEFDQHNPRSVVKRGRHDHKRSKVNKAFQIVKTEERKAAIETKYVPRFFGITYYKDAEVQR